MGGIEKSPEVTAHVAQLVEHVLGKDEVTRSIRVVGSTPNLDWPVSFDRRGTERSFAAIGN